MGNRKNDKHRKLWFEIDILSVKWRVFIVDPNVFREHMGGREGLTIFTTATILISKDLDDARKGDVVFHELFHAVNFAVSVERLIKVKGDDDWEENLTSLQAPILYDTLIRGRMLKLPPIPSGW